ncbi:M16 family metallopeptidase [Gemmobacter nectariphilus]|uniref:M16 family metallopeptidase n=1 Tax=Gemmobacter nectariphilus TaxID=220343 RepID=UPI00041D000A|nr:pitrilysin family protein [Gemmobacter nectariphilus]
MRLILAILFALIPLAGIADERVNSFTLDNGLQVVVIEDHRAPVVVHMVWYRVGAADEVSGESGLAHFLEHLMFKGTKTMPPGEFSKLVSAQGGSDNAFTSWDYTAYFQRVAADRLEMVMGMEADRMVNLTLAQGDVDTERNVILEERATRVESDPGGLFSEQRQAAMYLNHPYGRPIIGWRHEIQALGREAAMKFYKAHYAPDNAILVVAGDVTVDEVRRLADQYYGPIPARGGIHGRERPAEPPQIAERRVIMNDDRVGQPYLVRSYLAPSRQSGAQAEPAALTVLAQLLGGAGPNSELARALQFDSKIAVQTNAYYDPTGYDHSTFTLMVVPAPGVTLAEAEAAMDAALAKFLETGVKPEDFATIMARIKAQQIYALDSTMGVARRYGTALTSGLTIGDEIAWPEALEAVTPDQVMEAARKVLDRRQSTTGWLRKEADQ